MRRTIVAAASAVSWREPVPAQRLGTLVSPAWIVVARSRRGRWCNRRVCLRGLPIVLEREPVRQPSGKHPLQARMRIVWGSARLGRRSPYVASGDDEAGPLGGPMAGPDDQSILGLASFVGASKRQVRWHRVAGRRSPALPAAVASLGRNLRRRRLSASRSGGGARRGADRGIAVRRSRPGHGPRAFSRHARFASSGQTP